MIVFFNKIINKICRIWRIRSFRTYTKNKKNNINIVGKITVMNPNVYCGNNVTFYSNVVLWGDGPITLGNNVDIGFGTIMFASKSGGGGISIGSDTCIAGQCYIIDMDHGTQKGVNINSQVNISEPILIGENVWIGAGAKILRGSKIGNGAVIGANAVVKGEIPGNAIAVGVPAKVIKYRK